MRKFYTIKVEKKRIKIENRYVAKKAFITGITGQDGCYLAQFLLQKGYQVHGLHRRCSSSNLDRMQNFLGRDFDCVQLHYGDLTDGTNLFKTLEATRPDEIYNLGAQSHVAVSFEIPEYTADVNALGSLRILEAMRSLKLSATRFYQASTSELFGHAFEMPQKETTPFYPRSPYAASKLYGYWIANIYREAYGFYACNGILFNHESPFRGEEFVTRKITRGLARIFLGHASCLSLGNLNAKRDWGHARDYVEMQWMILQQRKPADYIIATGKQHTVRDFAVHVARHLGFTIRWEGEGLREIGKVESINVPCALCPGQEVIAVDPALFRPSEVDNLLGDATKAAKELQWTPKISFEEMVAEMTDHDLALAKEEKKEGLLV